MKPHCVWNLAAELGERPVWVERERVLYFVDISQQGWRARVVQPRRLRKYADVTPINPLPITTTLTVISRGPVERQFL